MERKCPERPERDPCRVQIRDVSERDDGSSLRGVDSSLTRHCARVIGSPPSDVRSAFRARAGTGGLGGPPCAARPARASACASGASLPRSACCDRCGGPGAATRARGRRRTCRASARAVVALRGDVVLDERLVAGPARRAGHAARGSGARPDRRARLERSRRRALRRARARTAPRRCRTAARRATRARRRLRARAAQARGPVRVRRARRDRRRGGAAHVRRFLQGTHRSGHEVGLAAPARAATRWCALHGVHPNAVTP